MCFSSAALFEVFDSSSALCCRFALAAHVGGGEKIKPACAADNPRVRPAFVTGLLWLWRRWVVAAASEMCPGDCFPSFMAPQKSASFGSPDRWLRARVGSARMCIYHLSAHTKGLT